MFPITSPAWWIAVLLSSIVFRYFWPGLAALRYWMMAKRDEFANRAKIAKRERR